MNRIALSDVKIIEDQLEHAADFARLNYEWLRKYFSVEPHDREMLDDPDNHIMKQGGHLIFAKYNDEIIGVAALIRENDTTFELAKMAVVPKYQGLKIGEKLILASIRKAKTRNMKRLVLESSRKLIPAINLYVKTGFVEIPLTGKSPYSRCDIRMQLDL